MKGDVVFAKKIIRLNTITSVCLCLPPFAPFLGLSAPPGPLDCGRDITNHSVEPNIETFCLEGWIADWHRNPPLNIACNSASSQPFFHPILGKLQCVMSPTRAINALQPGVQLRLKPRQIQEIMIGFAEC